MLNKFLSDDGWSSRFAAVSWRVSMLAFVIFTGGLVSATGVEVRRLTRALPAEPPEVIQDVVVRNVPDEEGRKASFRLLLFSDEFRWRLNSSAILESGLTAPVFTDAMKLVLNDAHEIICVGASSEEIPPGMPLAQGRVLEEQRAARRAERIAQWVRQAVTKPIPIRKLNIGHHEVTGDPVDTSNQRRVVIILVLDSDDGIVVDQALKLAMQRESARAPIFETLLTEYSLAEGSTFEWVE